MTAFPPTSDAVRDDVRQEGARGGSSCPRADPRRREEGMRQDLSMAASVSSSWESARTKKAESVLSTRLSTYLNSQLQESTGICFKT